MIGMVALIAVLLVLVIALCYRLWKLRQVGGTAAILRDYPAVGGHGWRHGVMRYRGGKPVSTGFPASAGGLIAGSAGEASKSSRAARPAATSTTS